MIKELKELIDEIDTIHRVIKFVEYDNTDFFTVKTKNEAHNLMIGRRELIAEILERGNPDFAKCTYPECTCPHGGTRNRSPEHIEYTHDLCNDILRKRGATRNEFAA